MSDQPHGMARDQPVERLEPFWPEWVHEPGEWVVLNGIEFYRRTYPDQPVLYPVCQMPALRPGFICSLPVGHGGDHVAYYSHDPARGSCNVEGWPDDMYRARQAQEALNDLLEELR